MGGPNQSASSASGRAGVMESTDTTSDLWEFPRHRLKFFNILGEGAFGQVWRCEATGMNGKSGQGFMYLLPGGRGVMIASIGPCNYVF